MDKDKAEKRKIIKEAVSRYRERQRLAKQNVSIPPSLQKRKAGRPVKEK